MHTGYICHNYCRYTYIFMIEQTWQTVGLRRQTLMYFVQKHVCGSRYINRTMRRTTTILAYCKQPTLSILSSVNVKSTVGNEKQVARYCMGVVKTIQTKMRDQHRVANIIRLTVHKKPNKLCYQRNPFEFPTAETNQGQAVRLLFSIDSMTIHRLFYPLDAIFKLQYELRNV